MADEYISYEEAKALVAGGDWDYEQHLFDQFNELLSDRVHELYEGEALEDPAFGLQSRLSDFSRAVKGLALDTTEDEKEYVFPPAPEPPSSVGLLTQLRIGVGKIVKLSPTFKAASLPMISVICSFLLVSNVSLFILVLTAGVAAPSLRQLISNLLTCYEKLADPKELAVFEVLAHTQAQLSLLDYDAYERQDYDRAFAAIAPDIEVIAEAITIFPDRELIPPDWRASPMEEWIGDVESVLSELVSRKIVKKKGDRYSIVV